MMIFKSFALQENPPYPPPSENSCLNLVQLLGPGWWWWWRAYTHCTYVKKSQKKKGQLCFGLDSGCIFRPVVDLFYFKGRTHTHDRHEREGPCCSRAPHPPGGGEWKKKKGGMWDRMLVGLVRNGGNIMRDNTFTIKKKKEPESERERGFLSSQQTPPLGHYRLFVPMLCWWLV